MTNVSEELKMTVGKALGRIPSGVFILTTGQGAQAMAMMASWVQQCSFQPPMASVAIAKDREIGKRIAQGKMFSLHVLGEHDHAMMKKYARGTVHAESAMEGLEQSLAHLDCRVVSVCEFGGDHEIVVAEVTAGKLLREGKSFVHLRGSGFHY
jgi:flavin reductase (DIM6/NTAB) family NADH-FMN oxidoreductase RutF